MICNKFQHFKVHLSQSDRLPEFVPIEKKTRPLKISAAGTAIGTLLILLAPPVEAANLTFVSDRAALGGSDRVDWSILGPVQPPFKVLPNFFSVTSEQGLGINVSIPSAAAPGVTPPLLFQTLPSPGIPTNFASGDFILLTGLRPGLQPSVGNPGPLTISFDRPVAAAGTQIAVDDTFLFTASISAFDSNNNLLGSFSTQGTSSLALDNSAQFLGVRSDAANISRLVYSSSEGDRAVGINSLSIAEAVPEPSSMAATIVAGLGLFAFKIKKRLAKGFLQR
ncbi:PEP-CTERM sorting domain-containing protein [Microcoleus sp. F10-C6]|uniref:PEP-CTERM sorting domain-containing protein n=1 Tax=unclassified Microcoleus TaxID=2642155 RepID=UPI002FD13744